MDFKENPSVNIFPEDRCKRRRKRILFTLGNLEGGGAERVVINLLKHLDRSKFELHLAVVHYFGNFIDTVPEDIVIHDLKAFRVRKSFLPFIRLTRRLKPEVIFSTLGYLNLAIILLKPFLPNQAKVVVRETTMVSENLRRSSCPWFWKGLYRLLYNHADVIVGLGDSMVKDLVDHFGVNSQKIISIYNPVDLEKVRFLADQGNNPFNSHGDGPHVVAVGRLGPEKGFERLIRSFPALLAKNPKARLWILGKGELRDHLKALIDRLGLKEKVFLAGFQKNPFLWLKHADLFVLPSFFEGLPNTLLEALACGCPVVALQHPGGTDEVLRELNLKGRFVPSLEAWPEVWWERPQEEVLSLINEKFNMLMISREYENLFGGNDSRKNGF